MADAYDVVVVGGGSAGAALAARLSEEPERDVLLVEAGSEQGAEPPAGLHAACFFAALAEPGWIWPNLTATRRAGQAESLYARGRGLGGSSSVNAMVAIRGTVDDYERWAGELGCTGWGWSEMRDAFLAVEDDVDYGGDGAHGVGGPIPLVRVPHQDLPPLDVALRAAMLDLGYPEHDDYHAPGATGLSRAALTFRDGRRIDTHDAYLLAARDRDNLTIRCDVLVDRVLLDRRRAIGVRTADGEDIRAREVVVCAGAIHSPAILLRSGVGADDDLPVGRGLQDHAATPGFEVALRPEGRMSGSDAPVISSVLRYDSGLAEAGPNDMQIIWFDAVGPDDTGRAGGRLFGAVMRVFSSGTVRLRSDDPAVDPIVEFDMLSDERDLVRLRDCVRRMIEIVEHPAVAAITDAVVALTSSLDDLRTDDAIDAWLRANVNDYVHAAGSCRMGPVGDRSAVVDTDCCVIGYEGLRVCDASVMPALPKANTHLTTVAIAERLAQKMRA